MADPASIYWQPEWDPTKGVRGSDVPRVTGDELVAAMHSNVLEAKAMLERARTNLHRVRASGGVVLDAETRRLRVVMRGDGKQAKPMDPLAPVAIADWHRSAAEVKHWQEYHEWAKGERDKGTVLPDRRLPVEREELEEAPF